jgi:hypothetical protein
LRHVVEQQDLVLFVNRDENEAQANDNEYRVVDPNSEIETEYPIMDVAVSEQVVTLNELFPDVLLLPEVSYTDVTRDNLTDFA